MKHCDDNLPAAQAVHAAVTSVNARIIGLITSWSQAKERYADLRSQARTPEAQLLIFRIYKEIEERERKLGRRVRKRRVKSGVKFVDAVERIVGDLLRVRAGTTAPARVYRSLGKTKFDRAPVKYDVFNRALEGLKALELVVHQKGKPSYVKVEFDPGDPISFSRPGRASRFWAMGKLLRVAGSYGINSGNVGKHFTPEPPRHPLVLKEHGTGRGRNRERGKTAEFKHTPETKRLEADVRDLNDFLAGFELMGGEHYGYTRVFNNLSWKKGGRLYSDGEHNYQQLPETERIKMTISGAPVAEIDIRASQLTIYHARVGEPLESSDDPYALAGVDRSIGKLWTLASFGNSKPATRWPPKMAEEYRAVTGQDLGTVAKARDVGRKMLEALPALKKLEDHSNIWAALQFLEAKAVVATMLILMRHHSVPSLSMHDGIIVPRSQADLAKTVLSREFHRVVGVVPTLTVDAQEPEATSDL